MVNRILKGLREHLWECAIGAVVVSLYIANLKPGYYLSGWDNLQTELYPTLAIKRAFFAVWQEYQSLGLVSGMAHAADLVRASTVYVMSFLLPSWLVRYTLVFLLYLVGGIGVYTLIKHHVQKKSVAFFGALFYLLNFGAIQLFFLPYEAFIYLFAYLPWQAHYTIRYFEDTRMSRRTIVFLIWIFFLATPQAYVQTNFIVVAICLITFSLFFLIRKTFITNVKKYVIFLSILIGVNSFWLLPQLYFVLSGGPQITINSKINRMSTYDSYMQNVEKGKLSSVVRLEGYYLTQLNKDNIPLFSPWIFHRSNLFTNAGLMCLACIAIFGIISIPFDKTKRVSLAFLALLLLCSSMLLVDQFPFKEIGEYVRQNVVINQLFRSAFTKFIIPYVFTISYFMAIGMNTILVRLPRRLSSARVFYVVCVFVLFFTALPAFQGQFFSSEMRVKIPSIYHELFSYLKNNHKDQRIALFPHSSFWGWFHHTWGYNGSGFIWYGIEQPLIARTFDVWSKISEEYYWQVNRAFINQSPDELENTLQKYHVGLILVDKTILGSRANANDTLNKYLTAHGLLIKDLGLIKLYARVSYDKSSTKGKATSQLPKILQYGDILSDFDPAYSDWRDYTSNTGGNYELIYPYGRISSNTQRNKSDGISIVEDLGHFSIKSSLITKPIDWALYQPASSTSEATIFNGDEIKNYQYSTNPPFLEKNSISVRVPKSLFARFNPSQLKPYPCSVRKGIFSYSTHNDTLTIASENGSTVCFEASDLFIDGRFGYLIKVRSQHHTGKPVLFYVIDKTTKLTKLEVLLDNLSDELFLLAPSSLGSRGYTFYFQVGSYERQKTVHSFGPIEVYLFPVDQIQNTFLQKKGQSAIRQADINVPNALIKNNYSSYSLNTMDNTIDMAILNQGYDDGWVAYEVPPDTSKVLSWIDHHFPFIRGKRLENHLMVNGWANGWSFEKSTEKKRNYAIVYVPQYLEYTGMIILILTIIAPAMMVSKKKQGSN